MRKKTHHCLGCGEMGATERHDDSHGMTYYFHAKCWVVWSTAAAIFGKAAERRAAKETP